MNKLLIFSFSMFLFGCNSQDIIPEAVGPNTMAEGDNGRSDNMAQVIENSGLAPQDAERLPPNSAELEQALKNMLSRMTRASNASDAIKKGWVNGIYRVKKGDTISAIAHASVKGTDIRADFMLDAIVKLNPSAFIRGNPNWMLAGSKLKFPKPEDFSKLFFVKNRADEAGEAEDPFAGWIQYP